VGIVHYEGAKGGDEKVRESGSGGEAIVAIVKSADLRNGDHLAVVRRRIGRGSGQSLASDRWVRELW
jgi:hypothetical protein